MVAIATGHLNQGPFNRWQRKERGEVEKEDTIKGLVVHCRLILPVVYYFKFSKKFVKKVEEEIY